MITKSALLGRTLTADYRPSVMGISARWRDHRGAFSFWDIEIMRRDPRIRLGLRVIKSPIAVVKWKVNSENQAVAEWVDKQLKHLWRAELGRLLLMIDYGRAGGEVVWRLDEETDLVHVHELKHVYSTDMQPLELHGEFWGLRINGAGEDAPIGKCFYLVNDPELNPYYGRSRLLGAWEPWSEKSNRHGAKDIRRLWYAKNAFRGGMMRHPPGSVSLDGGDTKSNQDYAREIAEKIETGGILVLPGAKDAESGEFLWTYEEPKINGDLGGVREYVKDLDGEIFEGLEIPIEIIEAQQSGSWAGRTVPFLVFLTGEDAIADNLITSLDRHILRPGAEANFGRGVKYEIEIESLVPKDEQQPGGAGPAGGDPNDALASLLGSGGGGAGEAAPQPEPEPPGAGEQMSVERLAVGDADPWEAYVGKRGSRKGQQGWKNRITHRIAWGAKPRRWHAPAQRPALEGMRARAGQMLQGGPLHPDHVRDFVEEMLHMSAKDMRALASHLGSGTGHAKADLAQRIKDIVEGRKQGKSKEERDKKVAHLQKKTASDAQPWAGKGEPDLGKVYNAPTGDLQIDPSRFQFKLNVDSESGVTQELKSVKTWNPDFAGVVSVWKDPADGKTYVVNGHHRRELAGRLGVDNLAVRYIKAGSAQEARAIGALINIAEGRGTAVDAAKFMRDTGQGPEALEKHGVSLKGKVAADAATLTRLNDRLFDRVARGVLDEGRALAVAKHLPNHDLQDSLFRLLDKREEEGKDLSPKVIEEMAREMAATPTHTKSEASLFGDIESEESLFVERNELKSFVRGELAKDVNDFLAVASKKRAEKIGKAGNVIDPEENRRIADEAARVKATFDTLVNSKGEISDALNKAAADYAKAKGKKERDAIKQRATEAVKQAVFKEAGVGEGPAAGPDGGAVGSSVGGGEAAPGGEPQEPATAAGDAGRGEAEPAGLTGARSSVEAGPARLPAGAGAVPASTADVETPPEQKPAESATTMPQTNAAPGVSIDDIPYDAAYNAHRNSSFVPEKRAKQRQQEYVEQMNADWEHLSQFATTPEEQEQLRQEFERYKNGYRDKKLAALAAASRTASSMITGPARFPVEQNRKRLETEHKRIVELIDFRKRALAAIQKKLRPETTAIQSSNPEAVSLLEKQHADLSAHQERMKRANAYLRGKVSSERDPSYGRDGYKPVFADGHTYESVKAGLIAAGVPEHAIGDLLKPDYLGRVGYPDYAVKNNGANLRRIQSRIEEQKKLKATPHSETEYSGDVKVVEDPDAARIRIVFPGKPDRATIDKLKSSGFKWSPSEGAWQRHLNNAGRYAVESTLKSLGHQPVEKSASESAPVDEDVPPMLVTPEPEPDLPEVAPASQGESALPTDEAKPVPSDAGHLPALQSIGEGDLGRVGGVNVRRTGKDAYRVEVPAGIKVPAGLQTEDERRAGVVRGDAAKIAKYLDHVGQHDKMFGRGRTDALSRAEGFEEPSFMDAAGLEKARKGFEALPEGAAVVSLEPHSHGRVGRIVVDEDGRKRVQLDGEDGWSSSYVEPLDVRHSWRVDRSNEPEAPKQADMF